MRTNIQPDGLTLSAQTISNGEVEFRWFRTDKIPEGWRAATARDVDYHRYKREVHGMTLCVNAPKLS